MRGPGSRPDAPVQYAPLVNLAVEYSWTPLSGVVIEDGKLRFPYVPDVPGIYRFDLGNLTYVGETDRLRRRFQHYRTPGPTQHTNIRLQRRMLDLLELRLSIGVSIAIEAFVTIDGNENPLDFGQKSSRLLIENAALTDLQLRGHAVENL